MNTDEFIKSLLTEKTHNPILDGYEIRDAKACIGRRLNYIFGPQFRSPFSPKNRSAKSNTGWRYDDINISLYYPCNDGSQVTASELIKCIDLINQMCHYILDCFYYEHNENYKKHFEIVYKLFQDIVKAECYYAPEARLKIQRVHDFILHDPVFNHRKSVCVSESTNTVYKAYAKDFFSKPNEESIPWKTSYFSKNNHYKTFHNNHSRIVEFYTLLLSSEEKIFEDITDVEQEFWEHLYGKFSLPKNTDLFWKDARKNRFDEEQASEREKIWSFIDKMSQTPLPDYLEDEDPSVIKLCSVVNKYIGAKTPYELTYRLKMLEIKIKHPRSYRIICQLGEFIDELYCRPFIENKIKQNKLDQFESKLAGILILKKEITKDIDYDAVFNDQIESLIES